MSFYDLTQDERKQFTLKLETEVLHAFETEDQEVIIEYAAHPDTYIRKQVYLAIGHLYHAFENLQEIILITLKKMLSSSDEKIRQTAVYAIGEIADFQTITPLLEIGLSDPHHSVRNGVIGALKQLGIKDSAGTLTFARKHLHDDDAEIRRQVIHGIELYGRTHPQEILPLLRDLQNDNSPRVTLMIAHIISQISYKKGCLEIVLADLKTWTNRKLIEKAVKEILKVHSEQTYCEHSLGEVKSYIQKYLQM